MHKCWKRQSRRQCRAGPWHRRWPGFRARQSRFRGRAHRQPQCFRAHPSEQAHEALNAIRSRCREDHNRILSRLGAPDAISPPYADKPLAGAATPPLQSRLPNVGWDADTRIKISRAFAETLADTASEMKRPATCADELLDSEQPRIRNDAGSFAVVVGDEQPADGESSLAAVDEAQKGGWMASAADKQNTAWAAAFAESPANEPNKSAGWSCPSRSISTRKSRPLAPVDLDVEDLPLAPARTVLKVGRRSKSTPAILLTVQTVCARRSNRLPSGAIGAVRRHWSAPRWPMSRLQTVILALLVVDCILVGWRAEIVRALPQTGSFYKLVGLPVNLRSLAFDGVATTTEQHEGVSVLVVQGNIINGARTVVDVPRLKFIVRDASRQGIYSWTAVPSRTSLPPGEAVSFRTELASPPPGTHDVLLRFVDQRDIVATER